MDREQFLQLNRGDTVRVRSYEAMLKDSVDSSKTPKFDSVHNGENTGEYLRFIPPMREFCGQVLTVYETSKTLNLYDEVVLLTDNPANGNLPYRFTKEMLEPVSISLSNFKEIMR